MGTSTESGNLGYLIHHFHLTGPDEKPKEVFTLPFFVYSAIKSNLEQKEIDVEILEDGDVQLTDSAIKLCREDEELLAVIRAKLEEKTKNLKGYYRENPIFRELDVLGPTLNLKKRDRIKRRAKAL